MKRWLLRWFAGILAVGMLSQTVWAAPTAVEGAAPDLPCKSAILVEPTSGKVLYAKQPDIPLPPASITKIMGLLLVMEALDRGELALSDIVTASSHACSMGGSQIWLEPNEQMTVAELLKAVAVASANDAMVALGEHLAGSEEGFVASMNVRAAELGMENTHFVNATGLDEETHLTSAADISKMGSALLSHPKILEYTTIWMDSLRNGETELVNTNRLIRFYEGATGLKTGYTDGAGACLAATATRNGLSLLAVVLGCQTSKERFATAEALLNQGFGQYAAVIPPAPEPPLLPLPVRHGTWQKVALVPQLPERLLLARGHGNQLAQQQSLVTELEAPVKAGQVVGKVKLLQEGIVVGEYPIVAAAAVERISILSAGKRSFGTLLSFSRKRLAEFAQEIAA